MPVKTTQIAPTTALSLVRVSQRYGTFVALRDVSVEIPAGASVVLLGENGAGKSTLLKLAAGLTSPSYGVLTVLGETPRDMRGRIAYMSHATMLYDELTGLENLRYFAGLQEPDATRAEILAASALREVGLDLSNSRRVGEYSQGMRQRASLARVLLSDPSLLLLDEPFSNLDVASAHGMIDRLLAWHAGAGSDGVARTLLLTTHQAELAKPLARTTLTLHAGRIASLVEVPR